MAAANGRAIQTPDFADVMNLDVKIELLNDHNAIEERQSELPETPVEKAQSVVEKGSSEASPPRDEAMKSSPRSCEEKALIKPYIRSNS